MTEKKEPTIEISSLTLTIGKREINLTLDEARKLKAALNELFKAEEHHHWHLEHFQKTYQPYFPSPIFGPGKRCGSASNDYKIDPLPKYSLTCDVEKLLALSKEPTR